MFEFVLFAMSVFMAVVPGFLFYKTILEEPIKEWLEERKRAGYDAYIDSEEKRRTEFREEMSRLGFNSLNASASEINRMYTLYREEFPDLYKNKRIEE